MEQHDGGCPCGALRYAVQGQPDWVTICHCDFCKRATGSDHLVEPVFPVTSFRYLSGTPRTYAHRSRGSGKVVFVDFCDTCGTKVRLGFERWPDMCGICAGTLDDVHWFEAGPDTSWQVFVSLARGGVVIPAGIPVYDQHGWDNDDNPLPATVHDQPFVVPRR